MGKRGPKSGGKHIGTYGYIWIHDPKHPRSIKSGHVKEHIKIACEMSGRIISRKEIVHHIDGIKTNNNPENLFIFKDLSEHKKSHYSLINIGLQLAWEEFKKGNIKFDKKDKCYKWI